MVAADDLADFNDSAKELAGVEARDSRTDSELLVSSWAVGVAAWAAASGAAASAFVGVPGAPPPGGNGCCAVPADGAFADAAEAEPPAPGVEAEAGVGVAAAGPDWGRAGADAAGVEGEPAEFVGACVGAAAADGGADPGGADAPDCPGREEGALLTPGAEGGS